MLALNLVHVSQQFKHYFWHIIKGKLGEDMGQPGILTVSPARIPGCPTSSPPSLPLLSHVSLITLSKCACVYSDSRGRMKINLSGDTRLVMNPNLYQTRYKTFVSPTNSVLRLIHGLISLLVTNLVHLSYLGACSLGRQNRELSTNCIPIYESSKCLLELPIKANHELLIFFNR